MLHPPPLRAQLQQEDAFAFVREVSILRVEVQTSSFGKRTPECVLCWGGGRLREGAVLGIWKGGESRDFDSFEKMAHQPSSAHDASRIRAMEKAREEQKDQYKRTAQNLRDESQTGFKTLTEAFVQAPDHHHIKPTQLSQQSQGGVGGLMTVEQYKAAQQNMRLAKVALSVKGGTEQEDTSKKRKMNGADDEKPKKKKKSFNPSALSFVEDEQQEFEVTIAKNKEVDTSFLPDKEREENERREKERIEREFAAEQERIMNESLTVQYQYWDGVGHKKLAECEKKMDLGQFLEKCRKQLAVEFVECRSIGSSENMLCVIDDMIIPQTHSFYELEVREAFSFRSKQKLLPKGARKVDAVKVVTRSWYDKNKLQYPASRWILFDISKHSYSN
jgi:protein FAM50